jgi:outer membrane protein
MSTILGRRHDAKPVGINGFIGRRPIPVFGNSDGDQQMLEWTAAGDGARFMGIVRHTYAARERAYIGRLDEALDEATPKGWTVVDMTRAICWSLAATLLGLAIGASPVRAQDGAVPVVLPEGNLVAVGVGAYPDYIGSNDYSIGAIPFVRWQFQGERAVTLIANDVRVNVLDVKGWRFGPEGILRFGRTDVKDDVVNRVHEVDRSIDLGLFVGYEWQDPRQPRIRVGTNAWTLWNVTDTEDGGWTVGANVYGAYPIALPVTLTGGSGVTYGSRSYMRNNFGITARDAAASGLPIYTPDDGVRDVRGWLVLLLHLSPKWTVGAGIVYSWLADEAARSSIVSDRGSRNQFIGGIGAMYLW